MLSARLCITTCLVLCVTSLFSSGSVSAFAPPTSTTTISLLSSSRYSSASSVRSTSTTSLSERRWNFNEGQSPWGLKKNAEIWNGRVAQMAFVAVIVQELVTGKGVVEGIQEGNAVNMACMVATVVSILGLTAVLALKGSDNYVDKGLGRK